MVTIKDGCGCDPCDCDWKQKLKEAYSRAIQSVNKIGDNDGSVYFPDGTGFVKLPLPRQSDVAQIKTNAQDIAELKVRDELLDADITRIDNTDAGQDQRIQDNTDRINSTYNDLVATEATVATHDSEIITLQANNQALAKSLVSDVIMTDGTTAGSVQVSIEREDGALITSANYRWGKDIGVRLEAGTQEGFVKAVISLSDGTELVSNEYKIVEVLESDVYVTAITLVPDMTAGTIGGNISYSNGTTQTINSVSVPTAPGVTSAIEALQGRMTVVEQKNANQDASITAIDGRVQALENTPGIGQFANGRLGTISGSTTDGRVKAEDDGTGSVNGWSDLKSRITAAESNIVNAQNDISDLDGLVAGKVDIMQGSANAGKALIVGSDGNVTPGDVPGGEVWEEVDLNNWPTDWVAGDKLKVQPFKMTSSGGTASSWTGSISPITASVTTNTYPSIYTFELQANEQSFFEPIGIFVNKNSICVYSFSIINARTFNSSSDGLFAYRANAFNGAGQSQNTIQVTRSNISSRIYKVWRLKK